MEEKNTKKTFAYRVGIAIGHAILICLSICVFAILFSLTYRFVNLMFGGLI